MLHRTRRHLPHWDLAGSTYFVTFRLAQGLLSEAERGIVLSHIRSGAGTYYRPAAIVVMPDHVHLILRPEPGFDLPRVMKGIKGVTSRLVNQHRGRTGRLWQAESWDRIIRDEPEFHATRKYLLENPVRAGLCEASEQYPWLFLDEVS